MSAFIGFLDEDDQYVLLKDLGTVQFRSRPTFGSGGMLRRLSTSDSDGSDTSCVSNKRTGVEEEALRAEVFGKARKVNPPSVLGCPGLTSLC